MSFLSNIFGKKEPKLPFDFSVFKTDMHSHLIPEIDDGSESMENSLQMIKEFASLGYTKLVTTPHIMSDYFKNTPEIILAGLEKVKLAIAENNINISIEAAAEYYLDEFFIEKIKEKNILSFGEKYVLFELPFMSEPPQLAETTFELQMAGYKPILAHPERYGYWHNNIEKLQEQQDKGILLQVNLLSVIGHYGPEVQKAAEKLIHNDLFDLVGTDCHRVQHLETLKNAAIKESLLRKIETKAINHQL